MNPNQRNMLDSLEYHVNPLQDLAEFLGWAVLAVFVAVMAFSALQGWALAATKAHCQDVAAYYGVGPLSPKDHSMLPPGVGIKWVNWSCVRTDNLTEMTGKEID